MKNIKFKSQESDKILSFYRLGSEDKRNKKQFSIPKEAKNNKSFKKAYKNGYHDL